MATFRFAKPVALTVGVLVLAGCAAQGPPAPTTAAPTRPAAASTCVSDPAKSIEAEATTTMVSGTLPDSLVASLDEAAKAAFALGASPGAIVGVRTPDGTWTKAYGLADPEANTPMAVGMHTRIASLTKMYAGTIVMQLAEEGELALDDTIGEYIDGVPNGDEITLTHLANMTSGVASYTRSEAFVQQYFDDPGAVYTPDEVVAVGVSLSPLFEPGEEFDYSNTNTVLLGLVIEKVTGATFADGLQERILTPLKLDSTTWPGESADIPEPYAKGFTLNGNDATPSNPTNSTNWNPSWGFTSGEIIADIDDLLTFGRALGTGQGILGAEMQTERLTSFPGEAGYGFAMGCSDGWIGHAGELSGYNTTLFYDTVSDTTVAVQANSDIASGACEHSPTLTDDPGDEICSTPATRIFVELSTVLGSTYNPPPRS